MRADIIVAVSRYAGKKYRTRANLGDDVPIVPMDEEEISHIPNGSVVAVVGDPGTRAQHDAVLAMSTRVQFGELKAAI